MTEMTGDNVRRTLRVMDAHTRRQLLVSFDRLAKRHHAEGDPGPLTAVIEAVCLDIYAAEDEERLLAADVDGAGDVDGR